MSQTFVSCFITIIIIIIIITVVVVVVVVLVVFVGVYVPPFIQLSTRKTQIAAGKILFQVTLILLRFFMLH